MTAFFIVLTFLNLLILGAATALGYIAGGRDDLVAWHIWVGLLASIVACAVHCIVFTYFVATGKWIQQAVLVRKLDGTLTAPPRRFRARATPVAMLAIAVTFIAAFSGGYVDSHRSPALIHALISFGAIAANLLAAAVEYPAIAANARHIDHILSLING